MRVLAFSAHAVRHTRVTLLIRNPDALSKKACETYGITMQDISSTPILEEAEYVGKLAGPGKIVFLDGYGFDEEYQRVVKSHGAFLVCMDDHHDRLFYADCVLNVSEISSPEKVIRKVASRLVYGLKYALIRPEFSSNAKIHRLDSKGIFICFGGGAETVPLISKTLQALNAANLGNPVITIVLNEKLRNEIEDLISRFYPNQNIQIRSNLSAAEMAELMQQSKIGICSSSTVSLEARALGLPIVAGYFVENQQGIYTSLLQNNEIPSMGNFETITALELSEKITALWQTPPVNSLSVLNPESISKQYNRLIHSWFTEIQFSLRNAYADDVDLYLNWANQPDVRQNAINSEPIAPENHRKWFASRILSESTKLYVGMINDIPVAQIRFDLHNGAWEIDYSVDHAYRNRGIGEMLIRKGMTLLLAEIGTDCSVAGLVKPTNIASAEVFKKLHFKQSGNQSRNGIELRCFSYTLKHQLLSL